MEITNLEKLDPYGGIENMHLIVYNDCYGGGPPKFSDAANAYYISINKHPTISLIDTMHKFGTSCTRDIYSKFGVALCQKKFAPYVKIISYDGLERPIIDYNQYFIDTIDNCINNDIHNITNVFNNCKKEKDGVMYYDISFDSNSIQLTPSYDNEYYNMS